MLRLLNKLTDLAGFSIGWGFVAVVALWVVPVSIVKRIVEKVKEAQ